MSRLPRVAFEDQFGRAREISSLAGRVAALVHAGRPAADAARVLGRTLHERLNGATETRPPVAVIPVIDLDGVPAMFHGLVRAAIRRHTRDVVVWIDFHGGLRRSIGLPAEEASVAVLDATGVIVEASAGPFGEEEIDRLVAAIDVVRG